MTESEYADRLAAGEKWCGACREWHPRQAFHIDRSRGDGLASDILVHIRDYPEAVHA